MPTITDFVVVQESQYCMSNVDFNFFIKSTWSVVYPFSEELKDNPTIAGKYSTSHIFNSDSCLLQVHNQIRTYRSETGKKAMSVVAQRLNMLEDDIEECTTWVAIQFHEDRWAYDSLGHTVRPVFLKIFPYTNVCLASYKLWCNERFDDLRNFCLPLRACQDIQGQILDSLLVHWY